MRQVELPGGRAILRDAPGELKVRHQRILDTAMVAALPAFEKIRDRKAWEEDGVDVRSANLTRQEADALMERQDAQMVALLVSWTLNIPLPTMDTIGDLDRDVYDPLLEAVRDVTNTTDVFDRPDFSPSPEEGTPTVPSQDSGQSARDTRASDSTSPSPTSGENTGTGRSSRSATKRT